MSANVKTSGTANLVAGSRPALAIGGNPLAQPNTPAPAAECTAIEARLKHQMSRIQQAEKGKELSKGQLAALRDKVKAVQAEFRSDTARGSQLTLDQANTMMGDLDQSSAAIFTSRSRARIGEDVKDGMLSSGEAGKLEQELGTVSQGVAAGSDHRGVFLQALGEEQRISAGLKDKSLTRGQAGQFRSRLDLEMNAYASYVANGQALTAAEGEQLGKTRDQLSSQIFADRQGAWLDKNLKAQDLTASQAKSLRKEIRSIAGDVASGKDDRTIYFKAHDAALRKTEAARSGAEPWKPGPGQQQGADTSNWESDAQFASSIQGAKWTSIKASQGTGYTDPTFKSRWDMLGKKVASGEMKLRMAFAYLDPGDGAAQAQHFLDVVGVHGKLPAGTRLALDWEGPALNDPGALRDAANHIHKVTGSWPVVYVQGSELSVARSQAPQAPIWEASWGGQIDKNVPFFQYSDGPSYDRDVFNGNLAALDRFAGWSA